MPLTDRCVGSIAVFWKRLGITGLERAMSHENYLYPIQVVDTGRVMRRVYPTHFESNWMPYISTLQLCTSLSSFAHPSSAYVLALPNPLPFSSLSSYSCPSSSVATATALLRFLLCVSSRFICPFRPSFSPICLLCLPASLLGLAPQPNQTYFYLPGCFK